MTTEAEMVPILQEKPPQNYGSMQYPTHCEVPQAEPAAKQDQLDFTRKVLGIVGT